MRPLRLLLIDGFESVFEGTVTVDVRPKDGRDFENFTREVRDQLSASVFDVIAVGNHAGLGLEVMKLVPQPLQPIVVVLSSNDLPPKIKSQYQAMGVKNFVLRGASFTAFLRKQAEAEPPDDGTAPEG